MRNPEAVKLLKEAKAGETGITVSIKLPAPTATPVTVRNVAGLLRGSDHALRQQYILLTAHHDHLGRNAAGEVFPGANDDGSGTVSVIELAQALARLRVHPKRSIVFMTRCMARMCEAHAVTSEDLLNRSLSPHERIVLLSRPIHDCP